MNALQLLQQSSGVTPDGAFGPNTFNAASDYLKLTKERAVHFFAQCCHESGHFKQFEENLNYNASALERVFSKYFDHEQALTYERNPELIANRVYANRMGNGDELSGDGWKYRGRGAIQTTGKTNYVLFAESIGNHSIIADPSIVSTELAFESALFFFEHNSLWEICDQGFSEETIKRLTKRINGGYHGLPERIELTGKYATYI